ncbi:MAG TPA: fumarylacetoacetate hydrolase family protein [Devosia sp.]|nr:fumarylacetoacetate hydrolase family protein [Devosia sp.]
MSDAIAAIAERLDHAAYTAMAVPQLSEPLDIAAAYAVQARSMQHRYARGERVVGIKLGFTSRAKMVQMGVDEMIWGRLTEAMLIEDGGAVSASRFIHPRVEPEIAYLLKRPLMGAVSLVEAMAAVEAVAPALEIIDSRYADFRFSLTDVVADNSSSTGFTIGPWHRPDLDAGNLGIILELDGRAVQLGSSAAILGHPARSLVAAARLTATHGHSLSAGDIVLAGAATAAVELAVGNHVRVRVQTLGNAEFSCVE